MKYLSDAQYQQFQADGYLVVPSFLTPDDLRGVRDDIQGILDANANLETDSHGLNLEKVDGRTFEEDAKVAGPGRVRKITPCIALVPTAGRIFTGGKMLDCMEDVMGADIYYHSSKAMLKPARGGSAKPWHQDAAYWRDYGSNQVTIWIAIHDSTEENGCVWAIPGSHKHGIIPHIKRELQVEESWIDLTKAVPVEVPAGGLLIFHSLVLHMSHTNHSDRPRWAIICDYDCLPNPALDLGNWRSPDQREDGVWPLRVSEAAIAVV